jgi:hypothetical protein
LDLEKLARIEMQSGEWRAAGQSIERSHSIFVPIHRPMHHW